MCPVPLVWIWCGWLYIAVILSTCLCLMPQSISGFLDDIQGGMTKHQYLRCWEWELAGLHLSQVQSGSSKKGWPRLNIIFLMEETDASQPNNKEDCFCCLPKNIYMIISWPATWIIIVWFQFWELLGKIQEKVCVHGDTMQIRLWCQTVIFNQIEHIIFHLSSTQDQKSWIKS